MELTFAAATDVGQKRDHNEDNFLVDKKLRLFLVADGMGGHAAGEVASAIAVHAIRDALDPHRAMIEAFREGASAEQTAAVLRALEQAVQAACAAVFAKAQSEPDKRGMGTTATALLIAGTPERPRGFIAHVGDSRVYLSRQGQCHALTEDHSLLNELVRRGKLNKNEIDASPYRQYKNSVTRAVGVYASVEVDTFDFDILPGDRFLICSDGLHAYLDDKTLPALLDAGDVKDVPTALVDLANRGGGHDNITGIVLRFGTVVADAPSDGVRQKLDVLRGLQLFRYLSYKELVRVSGVATLLQVPAEQVIFTEGQAGETMYAVIAGSVRLAQDGAKVAELGAGQHFGEMSLVDRSVRSLTAVASQDTQLIAIARTDFYEIIKGEPTLAVKLLWSFVQVLGSRLRKTNHDLSEALHGDRTGLSASENLFLD